MYSSVLSISGRNWSCYAKRAFASSRYCDLDWDEKMPSRAGEGSRAGLSPRYLQRQEGNRGRKSSAPPGWVPSPKYFAKSLIMAARMRGGRRRVVLGEQHEQVSTGTVYTVPRPQHGKVNLRRGLVSDRRHACSWDETRRRFFV